MSQIDGYENDSYLDGIHPGGINQIDLADYKKNNWPAPSPEFYVTPSASIYHAVRNTGVPNEIVARIPIKRALDIPKWQAASQGHPDDEIVLKGIQYGFSLQYCGDVLSEVTEEAHASGLKYPDHVTEYIQTEVELGAMIGPFEQPPFVPWCRTSPIMSRPKGEGSKRRVIVDLSYPPGGNVNQGVIKNNYYGRYISHKLPRIDEVVDTITSLDYNVALATVDIRRAYRNFPGCPLDYPLNVIKFQSMYYIDLAMPFGARTSSC